MLILLGANHRSAPVEFRERMSVHPDRMGEMLGALGENHGQPVGMRDQRGQDSQPGFFVNDAFQPLIGVTSRCPAVRAILVVHNSVPA